MSGELQMRRRRHARTCSPVLPVGLRMLVSTTNRRLHASSCKLVAPSISSQLNHSEHLKQIEPNHTVGLSESADVVRPLASSSSAKIENGKRFARAHQTNKNRNGLQLNQPPWSSLLYAEEAKCTCILSICSLDAFADRGKRVALDMYTARLMISTYTSSS